MSAPALISEPASNGSVACEHYEVWVLHDGEWLFKSSWLNFEIAWAVAGLQSRPVHIVRATSHDSGELERTVVAEVGVRSTTADFDSGTELQSIGQSVA